MEQQTTVDDTTTTEGAVTSKQAQSVANVQQPPVNTVLLSWRAPEFVYYEKDAKWFMYGGLATALLVVVSGLLQQWLMIVVIVILAGVIYQHSRREPRMLEYQITELGVKTGDHFHPYNELKSFWVIYNPPVEILYIETTRRLLPQIQVQLGDQDPVQVKQALHNRLPEQEKRTEDWLDAFGRLIRF